ncbi:hypothetical protein BDV59DRAFT_207857 [Aspergillus ambiguus]|uniref:uncharacterized protein n=1 Tax=Aspergillus ambiguus TaxID=176160 RepID=UPI003CCD73C0
MTDIEHPLEHKYMCTAEECTKQFTSIDDWRIHVEAYSFEPGHICLYDGCGEFVPTSSNESLAHRSHLYLRHNVEPYRTEGLRKAFIDKNFCSVAEGRMWCSLCLELLELDNRAKVVDHFQQHVRDGFQFKIPGQTKYPDTNRASKAKVGTSKRSANEGEDDVIDLSRRGTVAWIGPQPRERGQRLPASNPDEYTNNQLAFYRILTKATSLPYACPLCLRGYSRYDILYKHFKTTEEAQHRALKTLWFGSKCPVCRTPADQVLRHMAMRHPTNYQSLMKPTLRLRHEVDINIPSSPACFEHTFLFPLRRLGCIVNLPHRKQLRRPGTQKHISGDQESIKSGTSSLKKRKTDNSGQQQDIDEDEESRMEGMAPPFHIPGHACHRMIPPNPPPFGNIFNQEVYEENNLDQRAPSLPTDSLPFVTPPTFPENIQEPRVDLSGRGHISNLDTLYQAPWNLFVSTEGTIHRDNDGDGWQVTQID